MDILRKKIITIGIFNMIFVSLAFTLNSLTHAQIDVPCTNDTPQTIETYDTPRTNQISKKRVQSYPLRATPIPRDKNGMDHKVLDEIYNDILPYYHTSDVSSESEDTAATIEKKINTDSETQIIETPIIEESETVDNPEKKYIDDIDFSNKINRNSIPNIYPWETIAYVTCESAELHHVPITYGWSQDICDNVDICMANFMNSYFSEDVISIICGHNFKILKNLNNAEIGDDIIIETVYGANFHYRITTSCKSLLHDDGYQFYGFTDMNDNWIAKAWEKTNDLIVFTCYNMESNDFRWVVRAEFVEGSKLY